MNLEHAVVCLISEHQADVWRYLRLPGCDAALAADLTHETFLNVYRNPIREISRAAEETCLRVRGLKAGGRIEVPVLRNGDLVIGMGGEESRDGVVLGVLFQLCLTRETTTWKIIREGVVRDVTLSGVELSEILDHRGDDMEFICLEGAIR